MSFLLIILASIAQGISNFGVCPKKFLTIPPIQAIKRSLYSNALSYVLHFQSAIRLHSRSSLHTVFCFRSGRSRINFRFFSVAPLRCAFFFCKILLLSLCFQRWLFRHSLRQVKVSRWSEVFSFAYYGLRWQGIATYKPSATVATLRRRSSSSVPAPVVRSGCRLTATTAGNFRYATISRFRFGCATLPSLFGENNNKIVPLHYTILLLFLFFSAPILKS